MIDGARLERIVRAPSIQRATSGSPLAEDAVQEARIVVWRLMEDRPDVPDAYLFAAAHKAALSLLTGRAATGAHPRSKMSGSPVRSASLDALMSADGEDDWDRTPPAATVEGWEDERDVEMVVADALEDLDERDQGLLHLRFWEGYTETAAAKILGYSRARAYQRWAALRPVLAERLADLAA